MPSKNNTKGKQQQELEAIHVEIKPLKEYTYKKSSIITNYSTLQLPSEK